MLPGNSAFAVLFRNSPGSAALSEKDRQEERAMTKQTHDATRDPRTGRPKQPLEAERAKASPASPDRDMKETRPGRDPGGERPEIDLPSSRSQRARRTATRCPSHSKRTSTPRPSQPRTATSIRWQRNSSNRVRSKRNRTLKTPESRSCLTASSTADRTAGHPASTVPEIGRRRGNQGPLGSLEWSRGNSPSLTFPNANGDDRGRENPARPVS